MTSFTDWDIDFLVGSKELVPLVWKGTEWLWGMSVGTTRQSVII